MATTQADEFSTTQFKGFGSGQLCVLDRTHEITTDELAASDVIEFGQVPEGAIYVDGYLATDDLDSGTPAAVLDVGDDDDSDGLLDGTDSGQAAGVHRFNGAYLIDKTAVSAAKTISVTVQTAPATAVGGTVRVVLWYYVP